MCARECSARSHARHGGRTMWVACNRARFPTTRPRIFCELKIMKKVILIYQIIQEKFAYGELFILVMIGYIFMFKMVKKNAKFRFINTSWVNTFLKEGLHNKPKLSMLCALSQNFHSTFLLTNKIFFFNFINSHATRT